MRDTGVVKAFNDAKGHGLIGREHGVDVSVFSADIVPDAFPVLFVGRRVEFDVVEGPKGLRAVNVQPI
jgi:CspA family cold shock protein